MALSSPGSGQFVPDREWSCPLHDRKQTHECDCDACTLPYVSCPSCATAEWRDVVAADGTPVLRELSLWEAVMRETFRA